VIRNEDKGDTVQTRFFRSFVNRLLAAVLLAAVPVLATAATAPDANTYRLTDASLGKYEKATDAMYGFLSAHPELKGAMEGGDEEGDEDVTVTTRRLDQYAPGLRAAVERSGMSLEEYYTFTMVMVANAMAAGMADHFGGIDESGLGPVERANMAFIRKNGERMQSFSKAMEEKYASLMESDDGAYEEEDYDEEDYGNEEDYE